MVGWVGLSPEGCVVWWIAGRSVGGLMGDSVDELLVGGWVDVLVS